MREQQLTAAAIKVPAVSTGPFEWIKMAAHPIPLIKESLPMHDEGDAERLEQIRYRAMQCMTETQAQREVVTAADIDFADKRDITVGGTGIFLIQLEISREVLPSVSRANVPAG